MSILSLIPNISLYKSKRRVSKIYIKPDKIKVEYYVRLGNVSQVGTRYVDPNIFPRARAYSRLVFDLKNTYKKYTNRYSTYSTKIMNFLDRIYEGVK